MKFGILLVVIGFLLVGYLLKFHFDKTLIKVLGVVLGLFLCIYGLILIVQPSDDEFIKYTKTTKAHSSIQNK